jgi:Zn-dependent M28 family amino/carboxypeptidase
MILVLLAIVGLATQGCAAPPASPPSRATEVTAVDSARVVADLRFLSDPALEGRAAGSAGNETARAYILRELQDAGVRAFDAGWIQRFDSGANVVGYVRGTTSPGRFLVVTAHFDHVAPRNGVVFPGADDNASGTAALLEIARLVAATPLPMSVVFAALDAEEIGLRGARAFVASPPVPLASIVANLNMDMVSRSDAGELYVAGTYHSPQLIPFVDRVASRAPVMLLMGYDDPRLGPDDWTSQSDHYAFHQAGIPFLYLGVEDHPDYHRPTDVFEKIDQSFFVNAVRTAADLVGELARGL